MPVACVAAVVRALGHLFLCAPPRVFATPGPERLQRALDAALVTRQAVIEGKRRQLLQFMNMAPKAPMAE